jgi:hypothetical protein
LNTGNDPPGGAVVRRCRVEDNRGDGIHAVFRGVVIDSNVVRRNAGHGIHAASHDVTVHANRVEDNGRGLAAFGDLTFGPSLVTRNVVLRNLATGVEIGGTGVGLDRNQSKYNVGAGFDIAGRGHIVTLNIAVSNDDDGYVVSATDSTFERNTSNFNGRAVQDEAADGYGIVDTTADGGTAGTSNWYSANGCTGNGLGTSLPAGLCF